MGRDEVLEHGQALPEVGRNGSLDDHPRRLGHQPPHAPQLANLLGAATGPGVRHHEDRVEAAPLGVAGGRPELLHHLVGDLLAYVGPDVDHLVVAFAVGNQPIGILPLNFRDFFLRFPDQLALLRGNEHVIHADGDPCPRRVSEAEILDTVQHDDRFTVTGLAVADVDQLRQLLLGHQ